VWCKPRKKERRRMTITFRSQMKRGRYRSLPLNA
jgi:hypothetical protein